MMNLLLFFHGMTPEQGRWSPQPAYDRFWKALVRAKPELKQIITARAGIQWGHPRPGTGTQRPDERLRDAQRFAGRQTRYENLKKSPGPNNILMGGGGFLGLQDRDFGIPVLRSKLTGLREAMVIHGLGDVVYYTSAEGERQVRTVVYDQILRQIDPYVREKNVRLHVFGHSLGVTIAQDFLYGLFAKKHRPGFIHEKQGSYTACRRYQAWRAKAQKPKPEVRLASLASAASQLPLFAMRKQKLINQLARKKALDPKGFGLRARRGIQWKIFYDVDDVLGFATRRLYQDPHKVIADHQIDCGDDPAKAHTGYWHNETVIRETAALFAANG